MSNRSNGGTGRPGDHVESLARGLAVIKAFNATHPKLTGAEVAERTGLDRAAARRFLLTLESLGYVQSDGRYFALRPRVLELGHSYFSSVYQWDAAHPVMERLSADTEENVLAGVLDHTDVICVSRISRRPVTVAVYVGGRVPAFASGMGRAILAFLPDETLDQYFEEAEFRAYTNRTTTDVSALRDDLRAVREAGWSLVSQELEEGLTSLAVPIFDSDRNPVAALNISAHGNRVGRKEAEGRLLQPLRECAEEISLLFRGNASLGVQSMRH